MSTLPEKPSELIRLALRDLAACEVGHGYTIDMGAWHRPEQDGTCHICLAGAVMAQSLGADDDEYLRPAEYPEHERARLEALRHMLKNKIADGLMRMEIDPYGYRYPWGVKIRPYQDDPDLFKQDLEELARRLAVGGY